MHIHILHFRGTYPLSGPQDGLLLSHFSISFLSFNFIPLSLFCLAARDSARTCFILSVSLWSFHHLYVNVWFINCFMFFFFPVHLYSSFYLTMDQMCVLNQVGIFLFLQNDKWHETTGDELVSTVTSQQGSWFSSSSAPLMWGTHALPVAQWVFSSHSPKHKQNNPP